MSERNKIPEVIDAYATVMRKHRLRMSISQEELAHRAGLSLSFVSLLETGKRQPTISTISVLCKALDVSMVEFIGELEVRLSS
jgi:transcriptional regulator with XRE-family HTH domain